MSNDKLTMNWGCDLIFESVENQNKIFAVMSKI